MADDPKIQSVVFWGGPLDFSPSNVYLLNVIKGLNEREVKTQIYTSGGGMVSEFEKTDCKVRQESFLRRRIFDFFRFGKIVKEVKKENPQVIHLQNSKHLSPALKLAKKLKIPLLLTIYQIEETEFSSDVFKWLRGIVAVNEEVREHLVNRLKVPKELIRVIPPAVDLAAVGKIKEYEQNENPVVGTIDVSGEGLEDFVLAAHEIVKKNIPALFLIAGKGKKRSEIVKLAESKGILERFTFVETLTHSFSVIPLIDIYVSAQSPSKFGQDILDAMAWGKSVVAVGSGMSFTLIKDRETGMLVPPGDVQALARAILELIENLELRRELGEEAKEFVAKEFHLNRMVEETLAFYEKSMTSLA